MSKVLDLKHEWFEAGLDAAVFNQVAAYVRAEHLRGRGTTVQFQAIRDPAGISATYYVRNRYGPGGGWYFTSGGMPTEEHATIAATKAILIMAACKQHLHSPE